MPSGGFRHEIHTIEKDPKIGRFGENGVLSLLKLKRMSDGKPLWSYHHVSFIRFDSVKVSVSLLG